MGINLEIRIDQTRPSTQESFAQIQMQHHGAVDTTGAYGREGRRTRATGTKWSNYECGCVNDWETKSHNCGTMNTQIEQAIKQLERSERGQIVCKLLLDFLESRPISGLDCWNEQAVTILVGCFMLGGRADASAVLDALDGVVKRNPGVTQ